MMEGELGRFSSLSSGHSEWGLVLELIIPMRGTWCKLEGQGEMELRSCPFTYVPWQVKLWGLGFSAVVLLCPVTHSVGVERHLQWQWWSLDSRITATVQAPEPDIPRLSFLPSNGHGYIILIKERE